MKLFKATVASNLDPNQSGVVYAEIHGEQLPESFMSFTSQANIGGVNTIANVRPITYTSPHFSRHTGGLIALPNPGAEILVIFDEDLGEYFYLSTIVSEPRLLGASNTKIQENLIDESYLYDSSGNPKALTFKDAKGAGLKVSNYYDKNGSVAGVIGTGVQLKSALGHSVILSDSPKNDSVWISDRTKQNSIVINSTSNGIFSDNSITIKANKQECVALKDEYLIKVVNGRDLTLVNSSTGDNAGSGIYNLRSGNINLHTVNRDINIWADASGSRVFISTPGTLVQINSSGEILINSVKSMHLNSSQDINIVAASSLNIAAANINMVARNNVKIKGKNFGAEGSDGTKIGISSSRLDLNPTGGSVGSVATPQIPALKANAYGIK